MNEFLGELREMKTIEFWHKFLQNECQFEMNTTTETTATTATTEQTTEETTKSRKMSEKTTNRMEMQSEFEMSSQMSPKLSFSSSAFFDPQFHPSITDQVVMCRQIAKQLVCDESNAKSKGREMFEKRVQKSSKWVTTTTTADDQMDDTSEQSFHETTISEGPPNLRLLFDPRHVQDLNSLKFDSNEKEIIREEKKTRDLFATRREEIVTDLTSPEIHPNKGNALFAKRQQKSNEWIVAECVVQSALDKQCREEQLTSDDHLTTPDTTPETTLDDYNNNNNNNINTNYKLSIISNNSNNFLSNIALINRFRDFNAKPKPFVRMY